MMARSQKGQLLLHCSGYTFYLPSGYRHLRRRRWYCSTDRPRGCGAFVITEDQKVMSMNNTHNHVIKPSSGNFKNVNISYFDSAA